MLLNKVAEGRDNNLNLMRMVAAFAVLVSHSFALVYGKAEAEPLKTQLGMTLGTVAVCVFFVMSGFLLAGSLETRRNATDFFWARFLRVMPGLLAVLLLTVLVLGPGFTTLPLSAYFLQKDVAVYLIKGVTLLRGVSFTLPGVFENNPYPAAVNGSLWTLPLEIRMYAILLLAWVACRWLADRGIRIFRPLVVVAVAVAGVQLAIGGPAAAILQPDKLLFFMFFCGAAYALLGAHVAMNRAVFGVLLAALLLSSWYAPAFWIALLVCIGYLVLYLAYVPAGRVRQFNRLGDYSYGVYIYAFPVQQTTMALWPRATVPQLFAVSASVTLVLAVASWHLVEAPAVGLRKTVVLRSRELLRRVQGRLLRKPG